MRSQEAFVRLRRSRRFWLVNAALIALYIWSLDASVPITLRVDDGQCVALLPERSISIPCPTQEGTVVGVYQGATRPRWWQRLVGSYWEPLELRTPQHRVAKLAPNESARPDAWWDFEIERLLPDRVLQQYTLWSNPAPASFELSGRLVRPAEETGLMLLTPSGRDGVVFIIAGEKRRGVWWKLTQGKLEKPIVGVPFQAPPLAQFRTVLRQMLTAHHAALLLLVIGWLISLLAKEQGKAGCLPPGKDEGRAWWAPVAAMLVVFWGALLIANVALGRIPHVQDSVTYLFQAKTLARGALFAPAPPESDLFEQEFLIVSGDKWYGKYPPGYPALLAVGVLLGAPWLVNPLLAVLSLPLLYQLGRTLYGAREAWLTVSLAAVSPFFVIMSGSFMAHSAELFWVLLFMVSWLRAQRSQSWLRWGVMAGVALGMLLLTRQLSAVVIGLPAIAATSLFRWRFELAWSARLWRLLVLGVVFLPALLLLLAYQATLTGDPIADPRLQYWEFDKLGFGQDIGLDGNVFTLEVQNDSEEIGWFVDESQPPRGHTLGRGLYNTLANWRSLQVHLFGWYPFMTLGPLILGLLLWNGRRSDGLLLGVLGLTILLYVPYWASGIMYGPRYLFVALPVFLILTARGLHGWHNWLRPYARAWASITLAVLLASFTLFVYVPYAIESYTDYNFIESKPLARIRSSLPQDGKALVFVKADPARWWEYGQFFSANSPWLDGPLVFAYDPGVEQRVVVAHHFPDRTVHLWPSDFMGEQP